MKASIVPFEVSSKQSNGFMIWPPGKTSMTKRPPPMSLTMPAGGSGGPGGGGTARGVAGGEPPLRLRLRDDAGRVDCDGDAHRGQRAAGLHEEAAPRRVAPRRAHTRFRCSIARPPCSQHLVRYYSASSA